MLLSEYAKSIGIDPEENCIGVDSFEPLIGLRVECIDIDGWQYGGDVHLRLNGSIGTIVKGKRGAENKPVVTIMLDDSKHLTQYYYLRRFELLDQLENDL